MAHTDRPGFQYLTDWRLHAVIVVGVVLLTDVVVVLVDLALLGRKSLDTLLVSSVSGLIMATLVVGVAGVLRARLAQEQHRVLELGITRAQANLNVAVETAQMLFWEVDLSTGKFHFDHGKLAWLGMASDTRASSLAQWLALLYPEDRAEFLNRFEAAKPVGAANFNFDYRIQQTGGGWGWVHTQGRVKARNAQGEPITAVGGTLNITKRKQAELELLESERRTSALYTLLRRVADNVPDMIWAKDVNKRYVFVNKAICEQLLQATDTNEPLGKDDLFFARRARENHPDNPQWHTFGETCQDSDDATLQRGCASRFAETGNVRGQLLVLDVHKAPLLDEQGCTVGVVGSARDVTEALAAQEKLRIAAMVLDNCSEALLLSDAEHRIVATNPAFTTLTGYTLEEVARLDGGLLRCDHHDAHFYQAKWAQLEATGSWQGETWYQRKNGEKFAVWLTVTTLYKDDGSVHCHARLFSDITDKKRADELIWTQANFDALTGLPNRRMFQDRLTQDLKKVQRAGSKLALMFLDLDRFKEVNDTLGHEQGDVLLAQAAQRIVACTRASDTVARIGGDEFTVILSDLDDTSSMSRIASDILAALVEPFMLDAAPACVSVSIGVAVYPDDAMNVQELLRHADHAMYASKDAGRNCFRYFKPTL